MPSFAHLDPTLHRLPTVVTERVLSPALAVHLGPLRHNVRTILARTGGPERWRPHLKTTKTPALWRELLAAGVRRFKVATPREAWHLGHLVTELGEGDVEVLVAYPLVGPNLARLGEVARGFPAVRWAVLVEDAERLAEVPAGLAVFLDVNVGMDRTGVPVRHGPELVRLARAAGTRLAGLHAYDGHQHDPDAARREAAVHAGYDRVLELVERLRAEDLPVPEVVTAGTPAFESALSYAPLGAVPDLLHTVSPGTVVLHDGRTAEENPGLDLLPAATLLTRVVSHPERGLVTCDAGSKSIAAEAGDPCAEVLGHPDWTCRPPSEEHLPIAVPGDPPPRGTLLQLVPRHVCPTVNLAEALLLIEDGELVDTVPVAARAHEVWPPGFGGISDADPVRSPGA